MKHIQLFEQFINSVDEAIDDIKTILIYHTPKENHIVLTFEELKDARKELGRNAKNLSAIVQHVLTNKKLDHPSDFWLPFKNREGFKDQSQAMADRLNVHNS